ncbi:MAG: TRAP transporter small permease [Roseovarius sp.]
MENLFAIGAGVCLVIMAVLISVDVGLRYLFSSPLTFQLQLVRFYLLVAMFMLALPWGYRNGGAIQIQNLIDKLPVAAARPLIRIGLLASALYLGALAIEGGKGFWSAWTKSEVVMGVIDWPVAWSWIWIPLGCGMLSLRVFLDSVAPVLPKIGLEE